MPDKKRGIELPDLDRPEGNQTIIADNIRAIQPVHFAAMLDKMKAFQVLDRLVELFQIGILPVGSGRTGSDLYKYWKEAALRVSENERRNLYSRVLGLPGGDPGTKSNREFNDLWIRFISSVAALVRQTSVGNRPASSQQLVRQSGRDLTANLSLHGYSWIHFMAAELRKQINTITRLLSSSEIKAAYGARDMWQVIDKVAELELGGSRNTNRYRTMANAGAIIIGWLGNNSRKLSRTNETPILDAARIRNGRPGVIKPTARPTDFDLVNACEQWLAVSGTPDDSVDDFSQPGKRFDVAGQA